MKNQRGRIRSAKEKIKQGVFDALVYGLVRDSEPRMTVSQAKIHAQKLMHECKVWYEAKNEKATSQLNINNTP
jgi:hypothetical protein